MSPKSSNCRNSTQFYSKKAFFMNSTNFAKWQSSQNSMKTNPSHKIYLVLMPLKTLRAEQCLSKYCLRHVVKQEKKSKILLQTIKTTNSGNLKCFDTCLNKLQFALCLRTSTTTKFSRNT